MTYEKDLRESTINSPVASFDNLFRNRTASTVYGTSINTDLNATANAINGTAILTDIMDANATYFLNVTANAINGTLINTDMIDLNATYFLNVTANATVASPHYFEKAQHPAWLLYGGSPVMIFVAASGCVLNGFLVWVLSQASDRSAMDVIQMNVALCDCLDGVLGIIAIVIITTLDKGVGLGTVTAVAGALLLVNVTFEDLSSMLIMVLRTRQVRGIMGSAGRRK